MQKWEYLLIVVGWTGNPPIMEYIEVWGERQKIIRLPKLFDQVGENGWELVNVISQDRGWIQAYYFKRPLEE